MNVSAEILLGVRPGATVDEIRKAYYRAALKHHPDKSDSPEASIRFRQVKEAYDVLMARARPSSSSATASAKAAASSSATASAKAAAKPERENTSTDCCSGCGVRGSDLFWVGGSLRLCAKCRSNWLDSARATKPKRSAEPASNSGRTKVKKASKKKKDKLEPMETMSDRTLKIATLLDTRLEQVHGDWSNYSPLRLAELLKGHWRGTFPGLRELKAIKRWALARRYWANLIQKDDLSSDELDSHASDDEASDAVEAGQEDQETLDKIFESQGAQGLSRRGWERRESRRVPGLFYYWHGGSGASRPAKTCAEEIGSLPSGWQRVQSRTNPALYYYWHAASERTTLERPVA
eukprot:TRINITY_DN7269_c0_g1_i1.p1 TRINITY_DN7269_c0_g1~~TRINITY_DN7269_c0_g1_i1.p1  ORF type:complete len:377 (-),score=36.64 TRINITY_DN7269_c0_g1_i1:93-1142(-)